MSVATFSGGSLNGTVRVPGDKSISHRALILGAVAPGTTRIIGLNRGADVLTTLGAVQSLGATVEFRADEYFVEGATLHDPSATIDARNSGTTARLLMGLCAGHGITARFDGDASLCRRPMERVARPLRSLGAGVETTDGHLPAMVHGIDAPTGGTFALELPSAQLKSALLLATLRASSDVRITGDAYSRDHTERMLRRFGREITFDGRTVTLRPGQMKQAEIHVPGDLSAAAFFVVAAIVTPNSDIVVRDVGVNPTRTGVLDALRAMRSDLSLENEREKDGEPVADIRARTSPLRSIDISSDLVVRAIDEIPLIAVAAAFAHGVTSIRGAADLRTKESDRIAAIGSALRCCGIEAYERPDGLDIIGGRPKRPSIPLQSFDDHRIAMAIAVLAAGTGPIAVGDVSCIDISFPGFRELWDRTQQCAPPQ